MSSEVSKRSKKPAKRTRRDAFSPAQRTAFVDLILRSSSFRNACKLVGVSNVTAYRWLELGRNGGKGCTAAHKAFAQAYDEAEAQGTQKLLDTMGRHAENDFRAAKVLLDVRDQRFGVRRPVAKANLDKLHAEVALAQANARLAIAKAEAAEKALKGGGRQSLVLGITAILEGPALPDDVRARVLQALQAEGALPVASRDFESEATERGVA